MVKLEGIGLGFTEILVKDLGFKVVNVDDNEEEKCGDLRILLEILREKAEEAIFCSERGNGKPENLL